LEIIVATKNEGKLREIRSILKDLPFKLFGLNHFENVPDVEEDGKSFSENGLKKARFYSKLFGRIAIADDSGLEVDALGGRPGIYSARYAGKGASDQENRKKLLKELEGVPISKRGAKFKCAIAVVWPDGKEVITEGACRGRVGFKEVGKNGFGYDPLFILSRHGKTMGQLSLQEKNRISHRGKALRKLRKVLKDLTDQKNIGIF
jgi:non-canonical purine NTP pyrophosphatase (RdgB/HAM1 family)